MTATFKILSGKALKNAIAGYGKSVSTFTQKTHQLAFSAINHADDHNCASHINALYQATPTNYRGAVRVWACHFGKVKFNSDTQEFEYQKTAKSDLEGALATSPADFQKANKKGGSKTTSLADRIASMIKKEFDNKDGDHALARKLETFLKAQNAPALEVVSKPKQITAKKTTAKRPAVVKTEQVAVAA